MRITSENPIIQPGYPVPFSSNVYEVGQYAPSEHTLTALRLLEAKDLGLFLDRTLDIYDKEGNIDEEKIKRLKKDEILNFAVEIVDESTPLYALLNIRAVYKNFNEKFFSVVKFNKLIWHKKSEISQIENVDSDLFIIGHEYTKQGTVLHVFQPYYLYITVPIVKRIPNISQGISVASLATARNFASLVFKRFVKVFPDLIEEFINLRGWSKELKENYLPSGQLFNLEVKKEWYHKNDGERFSIGSVLGPKEDFVDSLVFYYFHRNYLSQYPNVFKYFDYLDSFVSKL